MEDIIKIMVLKLIIENMKDEGIKFDKKEKKNRKC